MKPKMKKRHSGPRGRDHDRSDNQPRLVEASRPDANGQGPPVTQGPNANGVRPIGVGQEDDDLQTALADAAQPGANVLETYATQSTRDNGVRSRGVGQVAADHHNLHIDAARPGTTSDADRGADRHGLDTHTPRVGAAGSADGHEDPMKRVARIVAECANGRPVDEAVEDAMARVREDRGLFKAVRDQLFHSAVRSMVTDCQHRLRQAQWSRITADTSARVRQFAQMEQTAIDGGLLDTFHIGGSAIGDLTGSRLRGIAADERRVGNGHLRTAEFLAYVAEGVPDDEPLRRHKSSADADAAMARAARRFPIHLDEEASDEAA